MRKPTIVSSKTMNATVVILLLVSVIVPAMMVVTAKPPIIVQPQASHDVIRINNDTDFDGAHGVNSGSGISGDPYVIDNWEIDGTGNDSCLYVGNTTKHYIVRNCTMESANNGIYLQNTTNATIYNNTIDDNNQGLYAISFYGNITGNRFANESVELIIDSGSITNITNNFFNVSNTITSTITIKTDNSVISNNTIVGTSTVSVIFVIGGSGSSDADNNQFLYNNVTATGYDQGISVGPDDTNNTIIGSNFTQLTGDGVWLYGDDNTVFGCNFDGRLVIDNLLSSASYNNVTWCNFTSTTQNNLDAPNNFIRNCTFERTITGTVIDIDDDDNTLDNLTIIGAIGSTGVNISSNDDCTINYCNITGSAEIDYGIRLLSADGHNIVGNEITNTEYGIHANISCNNNVITDNNISTFSAVGIYLDGDTNAYVARNNVSGVTDPATPQTAIFIRDNTNTTVDGCIIGNVNSMGVHIFGNSNEYINITNTRIDDVYDAVPSPTGAGVYIDDDVSLNLNMFNCNFTDNYIGIYNFGNSWNIITYHNNFMNSVNKHIDDAVANNTYDNGYQSGGNYYSDYTGIDNYHGEYQDILGSDNLGDTPQTFSPTQDNYPLTNPQETNNTPTADAGYDQIGFGGFRRLFGNESSDAGGSITNYTWNFTFNSSWYEYYTQKVNFTFDVVGEYNVTLNVTDNASNVGTDYVIINITSLPIFFDDGIYSTAWTELGAGNAYFDLISDRRTVHKLRVSGVFLDDQATIYNSTLNTSYENLVVEWTQNMTISDSDHVNVTVDGSGKLTTIEIYENKVNINGQDFTSIATKEGEWAKWMVIIVDNGTTAHVFLNGVIIGNQSTPYTGIADEILFELNEIGWNSSSESYIDRVVMYNYTAPTADAGPDQSGNEGIYTFDSTGSTGTIANYTWNFTHNSTPISLYGAAPSFNFTRSGNFQVNLSITDGLGVYDTDSTWVNITNQLPIANAGVNQTLGRGVRTLNGTGSYDLDGYITNYTWNFTDGGVVLLYGVSPTYNFTTINVYNITLNITDDEGVHAWDNVTHTIVNALPVSDAGPDQTGKRTKTFDGSSSYDPDWGTIDNYTWSFTYNAAPVNIYGIGPSFDFNITDNYLVTLNVTDNDSGTGEDTMWMNITLASPVADAGGNDTAFKGVYNFDGTGSSDADGSIINYTWNFTYSATPQTMYGSTPSFDFQILGFYNVTLNVTDDDYRYDEDIMMLQILPQNPIAEAGLNQTGKRIINFDGSSSTDPDGTIVNYTWNFTYGGSPAFLYGVNPSFDFNISGVYVVMLNVTDDDSLNGYDNVTITIVIQPPTAVALHAPGGTVKGIRHVVGTSSTDPDGSITNYTWNFTYDGSPVFRYTSHFWFDFDKEGVYIITLNVTDDDWRYDEDTTTITIVHLFPIAVAAFTVDDTNKGIKTFDGSGSTDSDGTIVNYTWNFTYDGSPETLYGVSPQFNFSLEGSYVVMLNVTDEDDHSDFDNVTVSIVFKDPVADAGNDRNVTRWNVVIFNGLGSSDEDGSIVNYTWNFTYGSVNYSLYGITPDFWVNQTENITVILTVTDDDGLQGFDNVTLYVIDPMEVAFNWLVVLIPLAIVLLIAVFIIRFFKEDMIV